MQAAHTSVTGIIKTVAAPDIARHSMIARPVAIERNGLLSDVFYLARSVNARPIAARMQIPMSDGDKKRPDRRLLTRAMRMIPKHEVSSTRRRAGCRGSNGLVMDNGHLRRLAILLISSLWLSVIGASAADRRWQQGTWTEINVRAMTDGRVYVIETDTLRVELNDGTRAYTRILDVVVGRAVTFAVDKRVVYIRDTDGTEHKLRLTKQTTNA